MKHKKAVPPGAMTIPGRSFPVDEWVEAGFIVIHHTKLKHT
jgi:hypothetical protein